MTAPPPSGGHLRTLEPMQPMSLKHVIKQEPLPYIKREDNNNAPHLMQLHAPGGVGGAHPHPHHLLHNAGYSLHNPGISPISPVTSMGSPGSPPSSCSLVTLGEKSHMGIQGPGGAMPMPHGSQHPGGGKMPSSSSSRKKSTSTGSTPEEDELASIPSLQMRIKILQQRVILKRVTLSSQFVAKRAR